MDYQSKNHARFLILSHLIFVWKNRKQLLLSYGNEVKQVLEEIAARSDFSFETRRAWIKTLFIAW
jgi:putative transposase